MKTKEEKALAIAEAMGWYQTNGVLCNTVWTHKNMFGDEFDDDELISDFTSYEGLMPIVLQIMLEQKKEHQEAPETSYIKESKLIEILYDSFDMIPFIRAINKDKELNAKIFYFHTKQEFLEALLDAVYFVLCEENNEN